MFEKYSKAGTGAVIVVITNAVLPILGIDVPEGGVAGFVDAIAQIVGFVLLVWGQVDRKDLTFGVVRK